MLHHPQISNLIGNPSNQSLTFYYECFTQAKISFCVIVKNWCIATILQNYLFFFVLKIRIPLLVSETKKLIAVDHLLN